VTFSVPAPGFLVESLNWPEAETTDWLAASAEMLTEYTPTAGFAPTEATDAVKKDVSLDAALMPS
jgi:hypothetical protein